MIVCDTGPLVAAALTNDDDHVPCVELLTGMHLAGRPLLVPGPVVAEVGYLLEREGGPLVEALFLRFGGSPPRARRRPQACRLAHRRVNPCNTYDGIEVSPRCCFFNNSAD